ncbi:MAG: hypothetical protein P4L84_32770 [Isosphaeraceae bacterium]|nr:hypothetical protein [Isosphaeraceae bacterium]
MLATTPAEVSLAAIQGQFVDALPCILRAINYDVRRLPKSARAEFEADAVAACWHAWRGLVRRGKDPLVVGPTGIAANAVRYVLNGRRFGTGTCGRGAMDVFNHEAQQTLGHEIINLDRETTTQSSSWRSLLSSDNRYTPADEAAFRVDFGRWLERLSDRKRQMAELPAEGHETGVVAQLLGVTAQAVSIARAWLEHSWKAFQGDALKTKPAIRRSVGRPRKLSRETKSPSSRP